ncbi:MAG: BamA/TamA family outer membrane protein [Candidatus Eiseniibacteriota bacterium]
MDTTITTPVRLLLITAIPLALAGGLGTSGAAAVEPELSELIIIGPDSEREVTGEHRGMRDGGEEDGWVELDDGIEGSFNIDFQRVDGLTFGLMQRLYGTGPYGPELTLREARAFHRGRWLFGAEFEQPIIPDHLTIGGGFFRRTTPFSGLDREIVNDEENLLAALLVKEDYRDYYEDEGVQVFLKQRFGRRTTAQATVLRSKHTALVNNTRTSLTRWGEDFRLNPAADEGNLRALRFQVEYDTRPSHREPTMAEWYRVEWERADGGMGGDFDYGRFLADLRQYVRTSPGQQLSWRLIYGTTRTGDLPVQKRFAIGGIGTLRAHNYKEFTGDEVLLGNLEYSFDLDRDFEAIVFLDTGATAERNASIRDRRFALDGGFGFGFHGERAAVYLARDLREPDADLRLSFRLSSTF